MWKISAYELTFQRVRVHVNKKGHILAVTADDNSAEPSKEQKSLEERVQAIVEKCAQKLETTTAARRNRPDLLTQASVVYHFENISKSKKATARAFGFSEAGGAKQVRGYVSKKQEIMGLLTHMRSKNKSLRSRKQVRASGVSAAHPELEKRVVAWRAAQLAPGRKVRSANLWTQVKKVRAELKITAKLNRNRKNAFRARHGLKFVRQKRSLTITRAVLTDRLRSFHTFTRALHRFVNFEFVGNFDQVPVSFNGEFLQMLVLTAEEQLEGSMTFSSTAAEDTKRFFTYLPLIVVRTDGKPVIAQPLPICIFCGEGNVLKAEEKFYDPVVKVFFQKKAVVDQNLMAEIDAYWEKYFGNQLRLLIGDSCRAHFTKKAKVCPNMVTNMDFNLVLKSRDAFFVAGKCKEGDILCSFGGGHHFCGSVFGHRAQFCMEEPLQQHLWR